MKKLLFSMLLWSVAQGAFCQYYNTFPKSLTDLSTTHSLYAFELPKKGKLLVASPSPKLLEEYKNIDTLLTLFVADYEKLKSSLEETTQARTAWFTFSKEGKRFIDIKTSINSKERYTFGKNGDPLSVKSVQDTLIIELGKFRANKPSVGFQDGDLVSPSAIYFYFVVNNLEEIGDLVKVGGVNNKIEQALSDVKAEKKHFAERLKFYYRDNGRLSVKSDSIIADKDNKFWNVQTRKGDFVALHASLGLGYLGNQWNLSTSVNATLVPSRFHSIGYTLGMRSIYSSTPDLNGGFNTTSNNFIQAGLTFYDFKKGKALSEVNTEHVIAGFYLGYLAHRGNSLFKENTWSLHAVFPVKGIVKISPELYFNGFFKNSIPGLRLIVGF